MTRTQRLMKLLLLMATIGGLIFAFYHMLLHFIEPVVEIRVSKVESAVNFKDNQYIELNTIKRDVQLGTVCQNLTCKSAYLKHLQLDGGKYPIPPIRHLMWRSEYVSAYFANQLSTWNRIHPDWTVVLWRDDDLRKFVRTYFPAALRRFVGLASHPIMQVDMVRYMVLFKYGGVYADLDYSLVDSLDEYRRFFAVVTREPENHSLQLFGFYWPPRTMANPAFMMAAPGHSFYRHCVEQLQTKRFTKGQPLSFAGPLGLTQLIEQYADAFPVANSPLETVYIPPSYSFYPYENNRMNTTGSVYLPQRMNVLTNACKGVKPNWPEQLRQYCTDPNNLDPSIDKTQRVVAVHDMKKSGSVYDGKGAKLYFKDVKHVRSVFGSKLLFGSNLI